MANEIQVWNKVLTSAMQMPGVKVDRDAFWQKSYTRIQQVINCRQLLRKARLELFPLMFLILLPKNVLVATHGLSHLLLPHLVYQAVLLC